MGSLLYADIGAKITIGTRELRFADTTRWGVVLSTYERNGKSRPSLNGARDYNPKQPERKWDKGLPDTWQYLGLNNTQNNHVVLTRELQEFWYAECVQQDPGKSRDYYFKAFNSLTANDRWTTNGYGSRTCANYVTGANLEKEPMRFFTLLTGRACLKITGEPKNVYGALCYPFEAINANAPLAGISFRTHPHLFYYPMNSVRTPLLNSAGGWLHNRVEYKEDGYGRFPQFDGKAVTPLFMPHTNTGWIEVAGVRLLDAGEAPPPIFNL